jgi:hypothetical protein
VGHAPRQVGGRAEADFEGVECSRYIYGSLLLCYLWFPGVQHRRPGPGKLSIQADPPIAAGNMATVHGTWTPPPLDSLSHRNCSVVAAWYSETVISGGLISATHSTVASAIAYLRSSLPGNLEVDPSDAQLMVWYLDSNTTAQVDQWMASGWEECKDQTGDAETQFCKTYAAAGDSDLTGPGVCLCREVFIISVWE